MNKDKRSIVFVDVDGTIVDTQGGLHRPSKKTIYAFNELGKNNLVFIASGRTKCMMSDWISDLNPNGFVLCNGAVVIYNNEVIYKTTIDQNKIDKVVNYCNSTNSMYFLENLDAIYVEDLNNPILKKFLGTWSLNSSIFKEKEKDSDTFIIMTAHSSEEDCKKMEETLKDDFDIRRHKAFTSFDLNEFGVNKGNGVKKAIEKLNLDINNSYAFGDGWNDVEMLQTVKHGVLMKRCQEGLEKLGFERCEDVLEDGFYHKLVEYGLIKPMD